MRQLLRRLDGRIDRAVGIDDPTLPIAGRIRSEQLNAISQLTPAMMLANVLIACVTTLSLWDEPRFPWIFTWAVVVTLLAGSAVRSWRRNRAKVHKPLASKTATRRAVVNAAVLGGLWGILPLLFIGDLDVSRRILVAVAMAGMLCGGAFALATLPQAVPAFLIPSVVGTTVWLLSYFALVDALVAALLAIFSMIIAIGTLQGGRLFVARVVADAEVREKSSVIGMLLSSFEEKSSDWLWRTDAEGRFTEVSKRFSEVAGHAPVALSTMTATALFAGSALSPQHPGMRYIFRSVVRGKRFSDVEIPYLRGDEKRWWRITGEPYFDDLGTFIGFRGVGSDITEAKQAEERITYLAHNDPLTSLPNRACFAELLARQTARMERHGTPFNVLYLDLDQFKTVNDTRGHEIGDRLLQEVTHRFASVIRNTDILARLGGDEFAILQVGKGSPEEASNLAARLIEAASRPVHIGKDVIRAGTSVGIAMAPSDGLTGEALLRNADLALYRAKSEGRSTYRFYQEEMDRAAQERRILEFDLSKAIENDELFLCYQPLIDVNSEATTGFEALLRWNHPNRGVISPVVFIPIAEETGLIRSIGDWVIRQACRTAATWPDHLTVAVNLSVRQFEGEGAGIVETVKAALEAGDLEPGRLELEITESLLMERTAVVMERLHELKALGVAIAMDDFGTGYSSLSYLWKFPFDRLKIDRSFVSEIETGKTARDVLRTIGLLGEALQLQVTAEGVETEEQVAFLRTIACHNLQGLHFAQPLKLEDLPSYFLQQTLPTKSTLAPCADQHVHAKRQEPDEKPASEHLRAQPVSNALAEQHAARRGNQRQQ